MPAVASAIRRGNAAKEQGLAAAGISIPLRGVALGNGMVDPATQMRSYADFAAGANPYGIRAVNATVEAAMRAATPACERRIVRCQRAQAQSDRRDGSLHGVGVTAAAQGTTMVKSATAVCESARAFCLDKFIVPYLDTGRSIYDIRRQCKTPPFCEDFSHVERFLQQSSTLDALSVRHSSKEWKICNFEVLARYDGDWMRSYQQELVPLLEEGIRVLVYAGDADYVCNLKGIFNWMKKLKWSGKHKFNAARKQLWQVGTESGAKVLGSRVSAGALTFLRVFKAGHMVPRDQPAAAAQLFHDFLSGKI